MGVMFKLGWLMGWFTRSMWTDSLYYQSSQLGHYSIWTLSIEAKPENNSLKSVLINKLKLILWSWDFLENSPVVAPSQELPNILRKKKVHYHVHKSLQIAPSPWQINPVRPSPFHTIFTGSVLILFTNLAILVAPSLMTFIPVSCTSMHSFFPVLNALPHHILSDLIFLIIRCEKYYLQSSLLISFLQSPVSSSLFCSNILLSALFTLSVYFSLKFEEQISYPYRTQAK
jgi:hypothetical protein